MINSIISKNERTKFKNDLNKKDLLDYHLQMSENMINHSQFEFALHHIHSMLAALSSRKLSIRNNPQGYREDNKCYVEFLKSEFSQLLPYDLYSQILKNKIEFLFYALYTNYRCVDFHSGLTSNDINTEQKEYGGNGGRRNSIHTLGCLNFWDIKIPGPETYLFFEEKHVFDFANSIKRKDLTFNNSWIYLLYFIAMKHIDKPKFDKEYSECKKNRFEQIYFQEIESRDGPQPEIRKLYEDQGLTEKHIEDIWEKGIVKNYPAIFGNDKLTFIYDWKGHRLTLEKFRENKQFKYGKVSYGENDEYFVTYLE